MRSLIKPTLLIASGTVFVLLACQDLKIVAEQGSGESTQGGDNPTDGTNPDGDTATDTGPDGDSASETDVATEVQACAGVSASPGDTPREVQVGDTSRSYVLHVPDTYTGTDPVPFIIDFHPVGSSGTREMSSSPYPAVTEAEEVVMAFPDGLSGPSGAAWNIGPCCVDDVDDVAFAREIVADAAATACIDTSRVYAVGTSMGGGMSHYLACEAADVFAAVAPSAFDLIVETVDECTPPRPISVVSFRGTSDPLVPYDGGYSDVVPGHPITFLGAVGTLEQWAAINRCTGSATDGGNGCRSYSPSQCEGGVEVMLCTADGGGIAPGDATIAWPILKRYSLP